MADDPFADYKSPSKTDDPFAGYKSPASTKMPAALTYDPNDPNASWGSWALSKLHNAAVGGNLWSKAFQDSSTFGGADVLQGKIEDSFSRPTLSSLVTGPTDHTAQLRAQTEEARKQIGPVGNLTADIAGYAMVPGGLKVGEGLAALAPASKLAQIGGSALEGAGASGLGTLGHGGSWEEAGKSGLVGGALGSITGALPGGHSTRPVTPSTSELNAVKKQAFTPLENVWVNSRNVGQDFNSVTGKLPTRADLSSSLNSKVDEIAKEIGDSQVLSADTIARYQRALGKSVRGGEDKNAVMGYIDALNTSLGPHAPAVADANKLANKFKISSEIDKWLDAPGKAPEAISAATKKRPQYYQSEPGLLDQLKKIGSKADKPGLMREIGNRALTAAAGAGIGEGVDYFTGGHSGLVGGAVAGALTPRVGNFIRTGPVRGGLLAAQHLNATGQALPTGAFSPAWQQAIGNLIRTGGYAAGSSGALDESAARQR